MGFCGPRCVSLGEDKQTAKLFFFFNYFLLLSDAISYQKSTEQPIRSLVTLAFADLLQHHGQSARKFTTSMCRIYRTIWRQNNLVLFC